MPNFDSFERYLRRALSAGTYDAFERMAAQIAKLPEARLPSQFKGRSESQLFGFLCRAHHVLSSEFGPDATFITSDNNQLGGDLTEANTGTEVELKSGPARTDANAGVGTIAWALEDERNELREIMTHSMLERRRLYFDAPDLIEQSKSKTMDRLYDFLVARLTVGEPVGPRLAHASRCYARGVNTAGAIVDSFQNGIRSWPRQYTASWSEGLVPYDQAFDETETLVVKKLERTSRVDLCIVGVTTGRTIQYYPNYKNSWKAGTKRVPADAWVQTPCFHIWIDRC